MGGKLSVLSRLKTYKITLRKRKGRKDKRKLKEPILAELPKDIP